MLIGSLIGGYEYFHNRSDEKQKHNQDNTSSSSSIDGKSSSEDNISSSKINDEESSSEELTLKEYKVATWNNKAYSPAKPFFIDSNDCNEYFSRSKVDYYKVATLTTGEIVVRATHEWDFEKSFETFIIDKDQKITNISNYKNDDYTETCLIPEIKVDKSIIIPEIHPYMDINFNNGTFVYEYPNQTIDFDFKNAIINKLAPTQFGDLFEAKFKISDDVNSPTYYLKTPDKGLIHLFTPKNNFILNDDDTLMATWVDENNKTIVWGAPFSNCESFDRAIVLVDNFNSSKGIQIGSVSGTNKPIYKLTDEKLLRVFYDEYYLEEQEGHDLLFDAFKNELTHIVIETSLGDWQVLANSEYSYAGECGKPVIYLYPEKDSFINVEVEAEITISDPHYPIGGWQNVFAKTDGSLTYNGKSYESLFWEGLGTGRYPIKVRTGKLVHQDQLISTIKNDLFEQGLNNKEISDFLEFWKDKLPKSPYVRLTWFNTKEMNELAPLKIYPRPQTIIRVFLEAKGYYSPITLKPQKLTKVERQGFTVVEWGGLLIK